MFCKNCGTDIPNDSKFCPTCGASVSEEKNKCQPDSLNTKATAENTNRTGKAPVSKIKIVGEIFLGIILLLLLICSSTFRSLVFIFAVIMIPVSLGMFVVGLIRKTPKKKWGIIFAVSFILAVVFSSGISSTADPIVGRWEGLFYAPKEGETLWSDDVGDFSCIVNKDGKTVLSAPSKLTDGTDGELTFYKSSETSSANSRNDYSSTPSESSRNSALHSDLEAWVCAEKIVKDRLKAPSTAKFCSMREANISHLGNGEYMVSGWVDAENSYGAKIRTSFIVFYTATKNGFKNAEVDFY